MHDPQFGLGIDTEVHLWHPCEAKAEERNHNDVDWVDLTFKRQLTLPDGAWSTERVVVQVRQEVAKELMGALISLFMARALRAGRPAWLARSRTGKEGPCQDATVEES